MKHEYFGLTAALLIFFSWLVSSVLSEDYTSKRAELDSILNDKFLNESLAVINDELFKQQNALQLIKSINLQNNSGSESTARLSSLTSNYKREENKAVHVANKTRISEFQSRLSARYALSKELDDRICKNQEDLTLINNELGQLRKDHSNALRKKFGTSVSAGDLTEDNIMEFNAVQNPIIAQMNKAISRSGPFQKEVANLNQEIYTHLIDAVSSAKLKADIAKWSAVGFYILGTILAIRGKMLEIKSKSSSGE